MAGLLTVLADLGVSDPAGRATVQGAVVDNLLERRTRGRRSYFTLTENGRAMVADWTERILVSPLTKEWDGTWTLLSFSLPESWRHKRHRLQVRLVGNGFGRLRQGLWIAPGPRSVDGVIDELGVHEHVEVFLARTHDQTDAGALVSRAWNLASLAEGYRDFVERWHGMADEGLANDLVRELLLLTEWRLLITNEPRLPAVSLPDDWPANSAHVLFLRRYAEYRPAAEKIFEQALFV